MDTDGTGGWVTLEDTSTGGPDWESDADLPYRAAIRAELQAARIDRVEILDLTMWVDDDEFISKNLPVNPGAAALLRRFASQEPSWMPWQVRGPVLITGKTNYGSWYRRGIDQLTTADIQGVGLAVAAASQ